MRSRVLFIGPLVVVVVLLSGCFKKAYELANKRGAVRNFYAYGPVEHWGARCDHKKLDVIYAPDEPDHEFLALDVYWNNHSGLQPMIIQIHGGAWEVGDKDANNSLFRARYLAARGYVVFNVNYRMLPDYPVQTQVEDVMGAVIWAKEHAAEFGADPERVGVVGGSAGGHLTAMVAWASDDPFFKPTGHEHSEYDSDVKAAVPFYGVFDLERVLSTIPGRKGGPWLKDISYRYFTHLEEGPPQEMLFCHISPKYHVDAEIPPTFFVCGNADSLDLYRESVDFHKILEERGVATGLYTAQGADHGFDIHYGADYTTEAMKKTVEWFDRFLK